MIEVKRNKQTKRARVAANLMHKKPNKQTIKQMINQQLVCVCTTDQMRFFFVEKNSNSKRN